MSYSDRKASQKRLLHGNLSQEAPGECVLQKWKSNLTMRKIWDPRNRSSDTGEI